MITPRTAKAELAVKMLAMAYAYEKEIRLTVEQAADSGLMQRLVDGRWDDKDFLIVKPGQKITEDLMSEGIIRAE